MTDSDAPLRLFHQKYLSLTGRTDRFERYRYHWAAWAREYAEKDLVGTLVHILLVNKTRKREMQIPISVHVLIGDLDNFERRRADAELDAKARAAKSRAWRPEPGQAAWAAAHGEEPIPPVAEPRMSKDLILSNLDKLKNDISKQ